MTFTVHQNTDFDIVPIVEAFHEQWLRFIFTTQTPFAADPQTGELNLLALPLRKPHASKA